MTATLAGHRLDAPDWLIRDLAHAIDQLDDLEQQTQKTTLILARIVDRLVEPLPVEGQLDVVRALWPAMAEEEPCLP